MNDDPAPQRVYVRRTIDEMRSSIQGNAGKDAQTHYVGKWVEQDLLFVDWYLFAGMPKCRFKTSETDAHGELYADFDPRYCEQIKNWQAGEKICVRGRIAQIGWDVVLEDCEIVS
jgi:hypothetical protein